MFSEWDNICNDLIAEVIETLSINSDDIFNATEVYRFNEDDIDHNINNLPLDIFDHTDPVNYFQFVSDHILKNLTEDNPFGSNDKCRICCHDQGSNQATCSQNKFTENKDSETFTNQRKPGRPRKDRQLKSKKLVTKRSEKLWEFLLHLLNDEKTCPHLIKWENYNEGTFKFVQNDKVAQLWGNRKKNNKMNYEKFSRAMRYYYKSQVLQPVRGKRLVYKFGPQAKGWRNIKPIL